MRSTLLIGTALLHLITAQSERNRRAPILRGYSYVSGGLEYNPPFERLNVPLQDSQLYSLGIDSFLPFNGALPPSKANIVPVALSNSVEKPVQESSDAAPPDLRSTAVIPLQPPPAVPVNAAAANVPGNRGAVFLGSGSLGVVNLGNGAFALGSGGIGYSDRRQQPRPSGTSPLFPPLAASPNLVPAATPSQNPTSVVQTSLNAGQMSQGSFQFNQPLFTPSPQPQPQRDQNGYERLNPTSAGFGMPTPMIRPLKLRMNYATPTIPQVTLERAYVNQLPQPGFGDPIPTLPPHALRYA